MTHELKRFLNHAGLPLKVMAVQGTLFDPVTHRPLRRLYLNAIVDEARPLDAQIRAQLQQAFGLDNQEREALWTGVEGPGYV